MFLKTGPGYGGSCFHKDLQALIAHSKGMGYEPHLLRATEQTNQEQARPVVEMARELLGNLNHKRGAVLGLAFKEDTDDIREAALLKVTEHLLKEGAEIAVYDQIAMPNAKQVLDGSVEFASNPEEALKGSDVAILMTEWEEFRRIKPKAFASQMRVPNIVDARRLYKPPTTAD